MSSQRQLNQHNLSCKWGHFDISSDDPDMQTSLGTTGWLEEKGTFSLLAGPGQEIIPKNPFKRDPELKIIYTFVRTLFRAEPSLLNVRLRLCTYTELKPKTSALLLQVYLERLLTCMDTDICPTNWKRILLGVTTLAYEFWDEQALWNVDFCQLINNIITVKDMHEIEMYFLHLIHFNISIPASTYARYYFDLQTLAHKHDLLVLFEPLCKESTEPRSKAAIFRYCKEKDLCRAAVERSLSADNFIGIQHIKAMLS
ncbi:cyclin-Y-like protein 1 [Molossus molossus]|uniref:cyclin-Y-like protein 1 n=1 Tax=Molossus molossus TaxID=27622 RepID=UPI0017472D9B|nr:cyclin-Y-like protein 1 [Molossus molossus]